MMKRWGVEPIPKTTVKHKYTESVRATPSANNKNAAQDATRGTRTDLTHTIAATIAQSPRRFGPKKNSMYAVAQQKPDKSEGTRRVYDGSIVYKCFGTQREGDSGGHMDRGPYAVCVCV